MFPGEELYYTDLAQHFTVAGQDLPVDDLQQYVLA